MLGKHQISDSIENTHEVLDSQDTINGNKKLKTDQVIEQNGNLENQVIQNDNLGEENGQNSAEENSIMNHSSMHETISPGSPNFTFENFKVKQEFEPSSPNLNKKPRNDIDEGFKENKQFQVKEEFCHDNDYYHEEEYQSNHYRSRNKDDDRRKKDDDRRNKDDDRIHQAKRDYYNNAKIEEDYDSYEYEDEYRSYDEDSHYDDSDSEDSYEDPYESMSMEELKNK